LYENALRVAIALSSKILSNTFKIASIICRTKKRTKALLKRGKSASTILHFLALVSHLLKLRGIIKNLDAMKEKDGSITVLNVSWQFIEFML
jgi:hypothetical protein